MIREFSPELLLWFYNFLLFPVKSKCEIFIIYKHLPSSVSVMFNTTAKYFCLELQHELQLMDAKLQKKLMEVKVLLNYKVWNQMNPCYCTVYNLQEKNNNKDD